MHTIEDILNMICTEAHSDPRSLIGCIDRCSPDELREVKRIYSDGDQRDRRNDPEFLEREKRYIAWLNGEEVPEDGTEQKPDLTNQES